MFKVFAALFALFCASNLCAQNSQQAFKDLESKVHLATLDNGLRVILLNRGEAPVFSGVVAVRVGGVNEQLGETGISHMFEHMAFKGTPSIGTKNYSQEVKLLTSFEALMQRKESLNDQEQQELVNIEKELNDLWEVSKFSEAYDRYGGIGLNATTGKEITNYFVDLPSSALEFWCWIESERFMSPVMRQFYKERDVVMEERRMRYEDDPGGKLYESLLGIVFQSHPYRNPVIGYPFDISRLTATKVSAFRSKYYVPSNTVVALVGDVRVERDLPLIKKYFGRLPTAPLTTIQPAEEIEQTGEREFVIEADASPQLLVAYKTPSFRDPDSPALSLMFQMLAGGFTSPIYKELVEKQKLATSVDFFDVGGDASPSAIALQFSPRSPHTNQQVLRAFDKVLEQAIRNDFTRESLERAKRQYSMSFLGHLRSNSALGMDLSENELLFNDWKASLKWFETAVTVDLNDISRVTKRYLKKSQRSIGRLEKKQNA